MIDNESIITRLDKLNDYTGYLKINQNISLDKLKEDYALQGIICRYFQLAIECIIDIAELLISSLKLRKPKDGQEAIEVLGEKKVIPVEFAKKLAGVSGFRNVLVHEYLAIDYNKVYTHLQNDLEGFDLYAKSISRFLQSQQK